MFETADFRNKLHQTVSEVSGRFGFRGYEPNIVDFLQRLAIENEPDLMEKESKRALWLQRGANDAIESTADIIGTASRIALDRGRQWLTQDDVDRAYRLRTCDVWPFCKPSA